MEKSKQQIRKPSHTLIDVAERGVHNGSACTYTYDDHSVLRVEFGGTRIAKDKLGRVIEECACLVVL